MSFDDEWAQQKSSVMERQVTSMQLNQLPADQGGGGGQPDLATSPAKKKAAANTIETQIQPDLKSAADAADEGTNGAVTELKGWDTSAGLKKAHEHWDSQVKRLNARLESEKSALRNTGTLFQNNDLTTGYSFAPTQSKVSGI
ncbi:hypothetical protein ACFY8W_23120 [Streptomyces sp. NPDC012637]|uniref:hypothetical protein n=1 Tax=Streptomyces sp. NPDC012637 TaxID=3364842 RepID=UPI0036F01CB4